MKTEHAEEIRTGILMATYDINEGFIRLYTYTGRLDLTKDLHGERSLFYRAYRRIIMRYIKGIYDLRVERALMSNKVQLDKNLKRYMEGR